MRHTSVARGFGLLAAAFPLMLCAVSVFAQSTEIPAAVETDTLYDSWILGPVVHTMQIDRPGSYALYTRSDLPMRIVVTPPSGRQFEHGFSRERDNFVFLDIARAGQLRMEFSLVDGDRYDQEPFYGFVVSESLETTTDAPIAGPLVPARVAGFMETDMSLRMYRFTSRASGLLTATADGDADSLTLIIGSSDGMTSVPDRSGPGFGGSSTEIQVEAGRRYGLLILSDPWSDASSGPADGVVRVDFSISDAVRIAPRELRFDELEVSMLSADGVPIAGRRAEPFVYNGTRGESIAVLMQSDQIDAYLYLETPAGELFFDDDGAAGTDSLIVLTLAETGAYAIYASSYGGREIGEYEIIVTSPQAADEMIALRVDSYDWDHDWDWDWDDDYEVPDDRVVNVRRIALGQTVDGEITADGSVFRGDHVEIYDLTLSRTTSVAISLKSDEIDAFLTLIAADGAEYDDDDGGAGTDSLLRIPDLAPGTHRIYASSYGGRSHGGFQLSVEEYVPGPRAESVRANRMEPGVEYQGAITDSSPVYDGNLVEVFEFVARAGARTTVTLRSSDFDAYLYVVTPNGDVIADDDSGGFTDAQVDIVRATAGTHRVYAGSYRGQETGEFAITVELGAR